MLPPSLARDGKKGEETVYLSKFGKKKEDLSRFLQATSRVKQEKREKETFSILSRRKKGREKTTPRAGEESLIGAAPTSSPSTEKEKGKGGRVRFFGEKKGSS